MAMVGGELINDSCERGSLASGADGTAFFGCRQHSNGVDAADRGSIATGSICSIACFHFLLALACTATNPWNHKK